MGTHTFTRLKAWKCNHTDRPHKCRGICASCYSSIIYKHELLKEFPKLTRLETVVQYKAQLNEEIAGNFTRKSDREITMSVRSAQLKAWRCRHKHDRHHARGLCRICYDVMRQTPGVIDEFYPRLNKFEVSYQFLEQGLDLTICEPEDTSSTNKFDPEIIMEEYEHLRFAISKEEIAKKLGISLKTLIDTIEGRR